GVLHLAGSRQRGGGGAVDVMQVATVVVHDLVAEMLRDRGAAALPTAPVEPCRRNVPAGIADRGATNRGDEASVVEPCETPFGIDAQAQMGISRAIELQRVAIGSDDDRPAARERD